MALTVKRPERTVEVCLDGTLTAEWESTRTRVSRLAEESRRTLAQIKAEPNDDRPNRAKTPAEKRLAQLEKELDELSKRAEELSKAAESETVTFRLRAVPRYVWDELTVQHPARPAGDGAESPDAPFPFNKETIADAAMAAEGAIVAVTRPDGTAEEFTGEDWPEFAAQLSDSQHADFRAAVVQLNVGSNDVPFFRASGQTRSSAKK